MMSTATPTKLNGEAYNNTAKEIGLNEEKYEQHKTALEQAFRNTNDLYMKTLFYHWNFRGIAFVAIHEFLEERYTQLAQDLDDIAERLKMQGLLAPIPHTVGEEQIKLVNDVPLHNELLEIFRDDHYAAAKQMRLAVEAAEAVDDVVTADLLTAKLAALEKAAWMCNASIEQ